MDLNTLRESLEALGTVSFCDWNNESEESLIISLTDFNGDEEAYQNIITSQVLPTCPWVEAYSYETSIDSIKAEYDKTVPSPGRGA